MQFPDSIQRVIVIDASVLINLLASLAPSAVLGALGAKCIVEEKTLAEVTKHPVSGRDHKNELRQLIDESLLESLKMSDSQYERFVELVSGDVSDALGDGESAAIALASDMNAMLALDDRKARRIVGERFPNLTVISSLKLFSETRRPGGLKAGEVTKVVNNAISHGRMRIIHDEIWLLEELRKTQIP